MQVPYHPKVKGFEFRPEGKLLRTLIEMEGRMGVAYERSIDYRRKYHSHDRLNLSFPRNACIAEIGIKSDTGTDEKVFRLDSTKLLSISKGSVHNHSGKSLIYDTVALYPDERLVRESAERGRLIKRQVEDFLANCHLIKRTFFLNELVERYFAERVLARSPNISLRKNLENQILDEILHLCFNTDKKPSGDTTSEELENISARALQFIEANLFAKISSRDIARYSRTSVASLFRVFQRDLGRTPFDYIRDRRLDEALQLLKGRRYSVTDVALLVGYEDLSAFSKAFKRKFSKNASEFIRE